MCMDRLECGSTRPGSLSEKGSGLTTKTFFGLHAGELMAVGGWENIATVENRYYKSSQEHEENALERVERG